MSTGNANSFENGTPSVTVAIPSAMSNVPFSHIDKTEKFKGVDFKPWQKKMYFYLTTLNLARFLSEDAAVIAKNDTDRDARVVFDTCKHSDFLCRNYVLNILNITLYKVYFEATTAKELWESLENKYKIKGTRIKKFVIDRLYDYNMVDNKTVSSQI